MNAMPGSSVSACHMCHMHGHSSDGLLRTNPLRCSKNRSKHYKSSSSSSRHQHSHSNRGYNSEIDDFHGGIGRANSNSSNLARLSEHSHSYGRNRSNSYSNYPEVSVLPGGNSNPYSREIRLSTRSLDADPMPASLPRVTSFIQPEIVPQPDILVNTMPQSRAGSRSGSISRTPAASVAADNSHDYYLHLHRQKFKDEKRKHRFNLQTVMLIGCYVLLVMVAIVIGVVVCYQNGWLGLGNPQERTSANDNVSNSNGISPADIGDRRKIVNENLNVHNNKNLQKHPSDPGSDGRENLSGSGTRNVNIAGFFPTGTQSNAGLGKTINDQRHNKVRDPNSGQFLDNSRTINNNNPISFENPNFPKQNLNNRQIPSQTTNQRTNDPNSRFSQPSSNIPVKNVVDGIIPTESFANPSIRVQPQNTASVIQNHPQIHQISVPHPSSPIISSANTNILSSPVLTNNGGVLGIPQQKSDSFSTQELLDLLAIRRMRDLLNSKGNTKNILELLRKVEPSTDATLENILNSQNQQNSPPVINNGSKKNKTNHQNPVVSPPSKTNLRNQQVVKNLSNVPTSFSTINGRINSTIEGAILKLLNSRVKANKNNVVTTTVRAPVTTPTPQKRPKPIEVSPKDLEILQKLFALNHALQGNVPKDILEALQNSQLTLANQNQPSSRVPKNFRTQDFKPRNGGSHTTQSPPIEFIVGNNHSKTKAQQNKTPQRIIKDNPKVVASSRGRLPTSRKVTNLAPIPNPRKISTSIPLGPDPSFAVLVKTGRVNVPKTPKSLHPSLDSSSSLPVNEVTSVSKTTEQRSSGISNSAGPIRELVEVRPGLSSKIDSDIIRAWTHMDSTGILSKGQVLSDGSFSFTNCRPVNVCSNKNNNKKRSTVLKNSELGL